MRVRARCVMNPGYEVLTSLVYNRDYVSLHNCLPALSQKAEEEIMLAQAEEQNLVDQQTSTVKKFIGRLVDTSEE